MKFQATDIKKEVKIDVADQVVKFVHEFEIKVDYCRCEECGEHLDFQLESDGCGDLQITVARCDCTQD